MATIKAFNYGQTPVAERSGNVKRGYFKWDVVAANNGDVVLVGQLPAGHRFIKELSYFLADGSSGLPGFTFDLYVDTDVSANKLLAGQAVVAATFQKTAVTISDANDFALGKSEFNRDIALALTTAPTTSGGIVYAVIAYAPD